MAPNCRNSDAGNSDMPKRKLKVIPLSERKGHSFKWKERKFLHLAAKKLYADATKIYGRKKSSIHEIVKREKQIHVSVAVAPQTAEIIATQCMLIA